MGQVERDDFSNHDLFGTVTNTNSIKRNISRVKEMNKKSTKKVKKQRKGLGTIKKVTLTRNREMFQGY